MRFLRIVPVLMVMLMFLGASSPSETVSCRDIIQQMMDSIKNIKTQKYEVRATERVNNNLHIAESKVKINYSPKKIYFGSISKGVEVLWLEGKIRVEEIAQMMSGANTTKISLSHAQDMLAQAK